MRGLIVPALAPATEIEAVLAPLLRYGSSKSLPYKGHLNALRHVAGLAANQFHQFPSGPIGLSGFDPVAARQGVWLRAMPIYFETFSDHLKVSSGGELELSEIDAELLAQPINDFLLQQGQGRLILASAVEWYLGIPRPLDCLTQELDQLSNRDPYGARPGGPDGPWLDRFMTELQMLCYGSELNEQREARGLRPVSGVWLSGPGTLPVWHGGSPPTLYSTSLFAQGLWALAGAQCERKFDPSEFMNPPSVWWDMDLDDTPLSDVEFLVGRLLDELRNKRIASIQVLTRDGMFYQVEARDLGRWARLQRYCRRALRLDRDRGL